MRRGSSIHARNIRICLFVPRHAEKPVVKLHFRCEFIEGIASIHLEDTALRKVIRSSPPTALLLHHLRGGG